MMQHTHKWMLYATCFSFTLISGNWNRLGFFASSSRISLGHMENSLLMFIRANSVRLSQLHFLDAF
jgi:hypothetical protein